MGAGDMERSVGFTDDERTRFNALSEELGNSALRYWKEPPDDLQDTADLPPSPSSGSGGSALRLGGTALSRNSHEFPLPA